MKIRVALDTSALRAESLTSGPFEALARFAEGGYVEILLPDVAVKEFNTLPSKKREAKEAFKQAAKTVRKGLPATSHAALAELETTISSEFDKFEIAAKARLKTWMKRTKAKVLDVAPHHGVSVIDKYFEGVPPFRSVKNRNDFPDAYIVEALLDAANDGEILVVAEDDGVRTALSEVPNMLAFDSLSDLLDSEHFDELKSEVENDNVSSILTTLGASMESFTRVFGETLVESVGGQTVSHYDSWNDETEQLYIDTAGPVSRWTLKLEKHEYLGEGVISVPFEAQLDVSLDTSTGDPFHDANYGTSEDATVEIAGWMSIIVENPEMLQEPQDWTGTRVANAIDVSIDDVSSMKLTDFERGSTKYYAEDDEDE